MAYVLVGLLSGIIGGMGIGGGTILIPILVFFFDIKQQIAQSINLISFIPLGIVAVLTHLKNNNIELCLSLYIIFSGLIGAVIGSKIAIIIHSFYLQKIFGGFLLFMGAYHLFCKDKN